MVNFYLVCKLIGIIFFYSYFLLACYFFYMANLLNETYTANISLKIDFFIKIIFSFDTILGLPIPFNNEVYIIL